ncbi:hypothetical protein LJC26_01985 [Desulfovibrio sp. OttesenSCG-928-O18]|nr:hypothetical protein [Desulfovibrio sp. OttesenSCG-928-O18]
MSEIALPTLPPMEVLLPCALVAAAVSLILAACFGPIFAVVSERLSVSRKRGFYAKTGQQVAQMSLLLGILAALAIAACFAWLASEEPTLLTFPYVLPLGVTGTAVVLTLLLLALYVSFRPRKGPSSAGHMALGTLCGGLSLLSLFLCTSLARRLVHTIPEIDPALPVAEQLLAFFLIPGESFFWPLLLQSVPLGFAFTAAFATVWLLVMRERQDFGRDYYGFALPYCAKWALFSTLFAIFTGAYAFFRGREIMLPELSHLPSLLLDALSVILPLVACLLWLLLIKSEHPMRRKISVILACALLLVGFAGQVLMFNKIIPSP